MKTFLFIFIGWLVYLMVGASADYTVVGVHDYNTMECYNYAILTEQAEHIERSMKRSNGLRRLVLERRLARLYPMLQNWGELCLK